ncbi:J-type co-chaperone Jac1p, mitochondrial [Monosporozyma servazzii]
MLQRLISRRWMSQKTFFQCFPRTFPKGTPQWQLDPSSLRKEYRQLQAQVHPDVAVAPQGNGTNKEDASAQLNKAYNVLSHPLSRAQYMIRCMKDIDLTNDEVSRQATNSDPALLSNIMDVHESLMECETEEEVKAIGKENQERMNDLIEILDKQFASKDYDGAVSTTVELKYWSNLAEEIKEWTPGSRLELHH